MSAHHLFPIRHHGPGSAWALLAALRRLAPDIILVEGPPEGSELLSWLAHEDMTPPIALLVYRPDALQRAGFFPFARFSPEYQALRFGLERQIPVRFLDLPQAHMLAQDEGPALPDPALFEDLGQAAGYGHYEAWWNLTVEQHQQDDDLFAGVMLLMTTLRATAAPAEGASPAGQRLADQREAFMRQGLRRAGAEGFQRIAMVCGAWHAPALRDLSAADADAALLTDLPQVPVEAAWVPWTYSRLAAFTGYGAGVRSPGWYDYLWQMRQAAAGPQAIVNGWLTRCAQLLREQDLDASAAHVIEAARLAAALAALRQLPFPGLPELREATQTVLCAGRSEPLALVERRLIVGERMGTVPSAAPMAPLQRDLLARQQELGLRPEPEPSTLKLDLRLPRHLARSQLLYALNLLQIPWGRPQVEPGRSGTYQELWQLQWQPAFAVQLIAASIWGNTVPTAAAASAMDQADKAETLPALTELLDAVLPADLPEAAAHIMTRLEALAAVSGDIIHMMAALPPLARVLRYGSARQFDPGLVAHIVAGLITRITIGLPAACQAVADDAAAQLLASIVATHQVVLTVAAPAQLDSWYETLLTLATQPNGHGLTAGHAVRLLLDAGQMPRAEVRGRLEGQLAHIGRATDAAAIAQRGAWLDGFMQGSELLLIHDHELWQILNGWVMGLAEAHFRALLPLLRRSFSRFSEGARQQLRERARRRPAPVPAGRAATFDPDQAAAILPLLGQILGEGGSNE